MRKTPFVAFLLIAAAFVHLALPVSGQRPSLGPLTFEEGSPLQRLGYTPMLEIADPVADGSVRMLLSPALAQLAELLDQA